MPRTNYDTPNSPDVERYRRARNKKIKALPWEGTVRGRRARERDDGSLREGEYRSDEEQARQQDWQFEKGAELQRRYKLNREKAGPIKSGGFKFTTKDAAKSLVKRKKRDDMED